MNFVGNKLFSVLLILGAAISVKDVEAFGEKKCKGMDIKITEQQMNNMKFCGEKMGVTTPEQMTKEKIPCFSKCIMEKKGLMDDNGKPHKENIEALIDSTMPEAVRPALKENLASCLDQHGDKIDAKDESCKTYGPLAMCTITGFMKICM